MKKPLKILFFLLSFSAFGQEQVNMLYTISVDSVYSNLLTDYRTIKTYLPNNYSKDRHYPVLYVLDGEWLFEPTVAETKMLSDFDVIPEAIVVGVYHKDRNDDLLLNWRTGETTVSSLKFKQFLIDELVPKIDSLYTTSGFYTLIGHSNAATFCQHLLTERQQPFRGFVALSQNLFGKQPEEMNTLLVKRFLGTPYFYFIASGTRDATPRLKSGILLDSLFRANPNEHLLTKHIVYETDHQGIAARGLNDGISHVFSLYRHYNDWDIKLIDSLSTNNISPMDFMNHHAALIKDAYGIEFKPNQDDLSLLQALTTTEVEIKAVQDFELAHFGKSDHFYATYAQYYEYIKSYEKALEYWEENLKGDYPHNDYFFYYQRPIQLLTTKMKEPKRAIEFASDWIDKSPANALYLNFMIAKIAAENDLERKTGLKAIKECIKNFLPNNMFSLELAKQIETKLN